MHRKNITFLQWFQSKLLKYLSNSIYLHLFIHKLYHVALNKPVEDRFGSVVAMWWRRVNGCGWPATLQSTTLTGHGDPPAIVMEQSTVFACITMCSFSGMMRVALIKIRLFVKKRRKCDCFFYDFLAWFNVNK